MKERKKDRKIEETNKQKEKKKDDDSAKNVTRKNRVKK